MAHPRYRDDRAAAAQRNAEAQQKQAAAVWAEQGYPADAGTGDLLARSKAKRQAVAGQPSAGQAGRSRTLPAPSKKPEPAKAEKPK